MKIPFSPDTVDWSPITLPFAKLSTSFVSGIQDRDRIHIEYFESKDKNKLVAKVHFGAFAAGPPKYAHGGAQAAVLDEVCGGIVWLKRHKALAAKLETEFFNMVPLETDLYATAEITKVENRKVFTEGALFLPEGDLLAKATVLFVKLSDSQIDHLNSKVEGTGVM
ncbi:MAG: PaaI family thioesterase [Pseudobacteriovorax sp.]|nr:PaaI family thioesterase [Pseudobacteriovorax sp.]